MLTSLALTLGLSFQSSTARYLPLQARQSRVPACGDAGQYSACNDGYVGCFSEPPCPTRQCKPACPAEGLTASVAQPVMYKLSSQQPTLAQSPSNIIDVRSGAGASKQEQAVVFKGIPSSAKICTFRWLQAMATERNFHVNGSGLVSITHLTGFPAENSSISASSIAPFEDPTNQFNIDFTSWDLLPDAATHIGSIINCSETVYVKAAINRLNGDGQVYFEQDQQNGLYIEYSC